MPQCLNRRVLRSRRRAHDGKLVNLGDLLHQSGRTAGKPHAPSRHGKGLGESVDHHRALLHALHCRRRNMALAAEGQFRIDFIGKHQYVRPAQDFRQRFQIHPFHNAARWVAGIRQNQQLGAVGQRAAQHFGGHAEVMLRRGFQNYGNPARQPHERLVADIARLRNDDLIPGADHRADCPVDGFRAAHRDQNLVRRVVGKPVFALHPVRNFLPQLFQTAIGGIARFSRLQREDARLADLPRGRKIGFSHAERDDILHRVRDVKKFPDAGGFDLLHHGGKQLCVVHHSR